MMLLWLLALVGAAWAAAARFRRRNMYALAAAIPAPAGELPLIGVAHLLAGNTEDIMSNIAKISYTAMEHGGMTRCWLFHILFFMVVDPVDLEMLLKVCLEKDDINRFIRNVIGNGSIFAPVAIWRRRRKVLVPVFTPKIVESFMTVFSMKGHILSESLGKLADKKKFSMWRKISNCTLDSVLETVMGVTMNTQKEPEPTMLRCMSRLLNIICERMFNVWQHPDWLFRMLRDKHREHQNCIEEINLFTDNIIELKRKEIKLEKGSDPTTNRDTEPRAYKLKSFLEHLISESGGDAGYTDTELREEVLTLIVAGTDTSAVCIGYTLKLLGKYPDIQNRVYDELNKVFGDSDRLVVKQDLAELQYLERVVKESLRLFPPVPLITRQIDRDIKLPSGRVLPGGSNVVASIFGLHRDPKYWGPDAEHFDPDRFSPERFDLAHNCSFMPFSFGPRNCVGYQYALMSIKTILASILRRYAVLGDAEGGPAPTIRLKLDIMMKAVDDYEVALERRP